VIQTKKSLIFTFLILAILPFVFTAGEPTYSTNSTNSTTAGADILHSLKWVSNQLKEHYNTDDDSQMLVHSTQWSAQTFNTSVSYDIKTVGVKLYKATNGMINISIYPTNATGHPDCSGSPLISGEFNGSILGSSPGAWYNLSFDSSYSIVADTDYAIVVYVENVTVVGGSIDWRMDTSGASYAGGSRYSSTSTGVNWTLGSGDDMMFETYSDSELSGYIFSFDNGTGTLVNDSWVAMTGTLNWSNVTKTVNSTVGATINWKVHANDTSDNWNNSETFSYVTTGSDSTAPTCTFSVTPNDIEENSTGLYEILINCTDTSEINISRFIIITTVDGSAHPGIPNYWSIRPPENNKSESHIIHNIPQILMADGRNDGKWYDTDSLFADNFTYSVQGEDSVYVDITSGTGWAQLNFTRAIEASAFRKSAFLSTGKMEKEEKKEYLINKNDNLLVKFWNLESMRDTANYTTCIFRNINYSGNPNKDLIAYFCNSSYDPTDSTKTKDSTNCVFVNSLDKTDLEDIYYSSRNSSYSKSCYAVIDGKLGGITATDIIYVSYESTLNSAVGNYLVRYANGSSGTNVSFKDSKVAWTSTDDGTTWTQAEFTPDIWFSGVNDGDQFQAGVYVEDELGNSYTNFTFYTDDIGDVNFPITSPNIQFYAQGIKAEGDHSGEDGDLNKTYSDYMTVHANMAKDPDAVGAVNHSLYLYNTDGTLNMTINNSFYSSDDSDVHVYFDTNLAEDGSYKMNITAIADDNSNNIESHLTCENFTIDNTNPLISFDTGTPSNATTSSLKYIFINFTFTELNLKNITARLYNSTGLENETTFLTATYEINFTGLDYDVYYFNITIYDQAGNLNYTETRKRTLVVGATPTVGGLGPDGSSDVTIQETEVETERKAEIKDKDWVYRIGFAFSEENPVFGFIVFCGLIILLFLSFNTAPEFWKIFLWNSHNKGGKR